MCYPLTTDALSLFHDVRSLLPRKNQLVRVPTPECLGQCLRVTNKGESRSGKASYRVKAEDHKGKGFRWLCGGGALSVEGEKLGRWKAIIGFPVSPPSALVKR